MTAERTEAQPIELTLVRHGESTFNVTGRWQGQGDAPLSELGQKQAAWVGQRLAAEAFDRVISSDLQRAHHTALATGHEVETRRAWREIDVGRWEGMTRPEVAERFPEEVAAAMRGDNVKIGGAESWADLSERVEAAMLELARELKPGQKAAVFAHGGVIASLVSGVLGLRRHQPRPIGRISNTAISRVQVWLNPAQDAVAHARLLAFNDASHAFTIPAWAEEMTRSGHPVTTLIAQGPEDLVEAHLERLRAPAELGDDVLALREVVQLASGVDAGVAEAQEYLQRAKGRTALVLQPAVIAELAQTRMRHEPAGPASVAPPDGGSCTHVVVTKKGQTFADYGATHGANTPGGADTAGTSAQGE